MSNSKPTIAIDIDDVLAEGTLALVDSVNRIYGSSLTIDDYHKIGGDFMGYYERVWKAHGLEHTIRLEDLGKEMALDQSHVPLLAGAEFAVGELSKRFKVIFITARPAAWEKATRRWFADNLSHKDIELYFAGNHYDDTALTKGQLAKKLNVRLLIDDNVTNCQSALDEGVQTILFGAYGWQHNAPEGMVRCKDWPQALDYLNEATI